MPVLGSDATSLAGKIDLHFAMARVFENQEDYDRAFGHWQTGNRLKRSTFDYDDAVREAAFQSIMDVFSQEPLTRTGHLMSRLYEMDNVILSPHLTFYTAEAMRRLEDETLERCFEILEGREMVVKSADPRLR